MKLPPGRDLGEFMELKFKPGSWEKNGIPSEGCRVRTATFERLMDQGGSYEIDDLIYGLMDWLDVAEDPRPALKTLRMILDRHFPPDGRTSARCRFQDEQGIDRIFRVGPVDPSADVVAWQRRSWVIALAGPDEEEPGRIVVAAPGPISLSVAQRILALGLTCFMMEPFNSYIGAQTMSRSTAAVYAWKAGEATTCHWEYGLGKRVDGREIVDCSGELDDLPKDGWLAPNQLAMMVAIAAGYLK